MDDMQKKLLRNIYEQVTQGLHSDLTIFFQEGETTTGSRVCLASLSPYFSAMLTLDMKEKISGVINLPTVSMATYQDIMKTYFLNQDVIKEENFSALFEASQMMELIHLENLCFHYFKKHLSLSNCLCIWRLLRQYSSTEAAKRVFKYITKYFDHLSLTEFVGQVTQSEIIEIISSKTLLCKETYVLKAVMKWIAVNNPSSDDVSKMFSHIHLEIVNPKYLIQNIVYSSTVVANEELKPMVQKALCHNLTLFAEHRSDTVELDIALVFGTGSCVDNHLLFAASLTEQRWYNMPYAPSSPGEYYSATVNNNKVYITGGALKGTLTLIYDLLRRQWDYGPDLREYRQEHCMATVNDRVYVIGGTKSSSIERLDEERDRWEIVSDVGVERRDACAVVVGSKILICGGDEIPTASPANHIFCFNTDTCCLSKIGTLPIPCPSVRAYSDLPFVYLFTDDYVSKFKVEELENRISLKHMSGRVLNESEENNVYNLGFVVNTGDILVFSNFKVSCFSEADDMFDVTEVEFDNYPDIENIFGVLRVRLPLYALDSHSAKIYH